jgi:alkylhydroperoxidase family enzyme
VKLTKEPAICTRDDITALRALGLADEDILDAIQVMAWQNYTNRISDALGLAVNEGYSTLAVRPTAL